ncbi:hypothetical protein GQ43DRAFT_440519 [Delitschia confertaspora ATCC 74209]|uniref:Uncharacterized protein n=1 Tax=Delitschia confertaspora ATCC 74209 TaxID=1513339 RepID=A0A9P4JRZ5_9PLEO|nr:hypothetical protein GQ43DRAFT_440519 [Delitschia confertaspora ATCC 74209]
MRTGWVAFWKATALFQFGVVYVFILPQYYHNENEPSETKRVLITLGVGILAMIPILTLSYLTAPFVKRIHLYLPPYARRSVSTLHNYSSTLPPTARLEFVTLRAFPFERTTTVLLSELRALPPQRFRYANIARVKTEKFLRVTGWNGIWGRVFGLLNEPRWKYYVKEGKAYTFRTKVPGVWENVARAIKGQTDAIADSRLARPVKAVK